MVKVQSPVLVEWGTQGQSGRYVRKLRTVESWVSGIINRLMVRKANGRQRERGYEKIE